jgi:hypothetical protein
VFDSFFFDPQKAEGDPGYHQAGTEEEELQETHTHHSSLAY